MPVTHRRCSVHEPWMKCHQWGTRGRQWLVFFLLLQCECGGGGGTHSFKQCNLSADINYKIKLTSLSVSPLSCSFSCPVHLVWCSNINMLPASGCFFWPLVGSRLTTETQWQPGVSRHMTMLWGTFLKPPGVVGRHGRGEFRFQAPPLLLPSQYSNQQLGGVR